MVGLAGAPVRSAGSRLSLSHTFAGLAGQLFPQGSKLAVPGLGSQTSQKRRTGEAAGQWSFLSGNDTLPGSRGVDLNLLRRFAWSPLAAGQVAEPGFRFSSLHSGGRQGGGGVGITHHPHQQHLTHTHFPEPVC